MRVRICFGVVAAMAAVVSTIACRPPEKPAVHGADEPTATSPNGPAASSTGDASSPAEAAVEPTAIAPIEPGTKIDVKSPPPGMHVVFRSKPKVSSGDVAKVGKSIRDALETYVTLVVVETEADPTDGGRFRRVAHRIGIGKPGAGGDTVFTKDTAKQLGISLGLFDRKVLAGREDELRTVLSPGASDTMAMFDYGMIFRRDDRRVPITVRYLSLIDPATGNIETAYWVLDRTSDGLRYFGDSLWVLPKNHEMDWEMHVDGGEVTFGAPSADAFTSTKLPEGTSFDAPPEFKNMAAARAYGPKSGADLERRVRELIAGAKK